MKQEAIESEAAPKRRLSIVRIGLALVLAGGAVVGASFAFREVRASLESVPAPWYAPYIDVTITPTFAFEDSSANPSRDVVLSFIVADPEERCTPSWGAAFDLDAAATDLDLDRRIARYRQQGGDVVVSFGGAINDELATVCTDIDDLADAYRAVIDRYDVTTIDLDIEADDLADDAGSSRRGEAIATVQAQVRNDGGSLAVWLTLPVAPSGLPADAVATIDAALEAGVDLAGVNLMTMNYGAGRDDDESMHAASVRAIEAAHRQLSSAYQRIDQRLSYEQVHAKIGVTPMIGQNDDRGDVFTLDDAESTVDYVNSEGLGRLGMWSLNRDNPCGPNSTPSSTPSNFCTSLDQDPLAFSEVFAAVAARPGGQAGIETVPLDGPLPIDDPATAPYPIWDGDDGFSAGDKTVWRGNVYESKWWNEGEAPDAPVINEWETPWRLIGPVLATDRPPPPPPTIPLGTFDDWDGTEIYEEGARVHYDGFGYESKWWNQGEQPGKDVPNDWDTPWFLIDASGEPVDSRR